MLGVPLQLFLLGEHPGPLERLGGNRVQRALHVDGSAGISILLPRSAEERPPLEHDEIVDTACKQRFRSALTAEPASDDDNGVDAAPPMNKPRRSVTGVTTLK